MVILLIITTPYLYGDTHSFSMDNDVFVTNKDAHYTGGLFYIWMEDKKQDTKAISLTSLVFTPEDKKESKPILDDLPYAGYINLNFLSYNYGEDYFHEFGINIGGVGPMTKAKELQSGIHKVIGATIPQGWDNQLKDQVTAGISYNFAKKTKIIKISNFNFDWTNNIRFDLGNFYSGALVSTTFRIGSNFPNTFPITGNFIGGNESSLLNFKEIKSFNWAISLSFFANKVNNYYIVDEAINQGYTIADIDYITGEQIAYDIFCDDIQYTFKVKSTYLHNNKLLSRAEAKWGEIMIIWRY